MFGCRLREKLATIGVGARAIGGAITPTRSLSVESTSELLDESGLCAAERSSSETTFNGRAFSVASEDDIPSATLVKGAGADATVKTYRYEGESVYNIIRDLAEEAQINIIIKGQAPLITMDLDVRNRSAKQVLLFVLDVNNIEYELSKSEDTLVVYGTNTARSVSKTYKFSDKVRRKAEGTFGILLSMSGFVTTMNAGATTGSRLNCIGLTARELMLVLEGMTTFARLVRRARAEASTRAVFYSGE